MSNYVPELVEKFGNYRNWGKDNIEEIIKYAMKLGVSPCELFEFILDKKLSAEVISFLIRYFKNDNDIFMSLKKTCSSYMQRKSAECILLENAPDSFDIYPVVESILSKKISLEGNDERIVAIGLIKALSKSNEPLEYGTNILLNNFDLLDNDDIVKAAFFSSQCMDAILEIISKRLDINKNDSKSLYILQTLSSSPYGTKAAEFSMKLKINRDINIFI